MACALPEGDRQFASTRSSSTPGGSKPGRAQERTAANGHELWRFPFAESIGITLRKGNQPWRGRRAGDCA